MPNTRNTLRKSPHKTTSSSTRIRIGHKLESLNTVWG